MISTDIFDELQTEWAPLDDPVLQITPTSFHNQASNHYTALGRPGISSGTFWDVYKSLLACFRGGPVDATHEADFILANFGAEQNIALVSGLRHLRNDDEIVGDGVVLREDYNEADFTDDEEDGHV